MHLVGDRTRVGGEFGIEWSPQWGGESNEGLIRGTLVGTSNVVAESAESTELIIGDSLTSATEIASPALTSIQLPETPESASASHPALTHGHLRRKTLEVAGRGMGRKGQAKKNRKNKANTHHLGCLLLSDVMWNRS